MVQVGVVLPDFPVDAGKAHSVGIFHGVTGRRHGMLDGVAVVGAILNFANSVFAWNDDRDDRKIAKQIEGRSVAGALVGVAGIRTLAGSRPQALKRIAPQSSANTPQAAVGRYVGQAGFWR